MEKVEQYIQEHTRNCSNEIGYCHNKTRNHNHVFYSWLTPFHAENAAHIAREETVKEVCEWIKKNVYSYTWYDFKQYEIGVETDKLIEDLKKYFVNE